MLRYYREGNCASSMDAFVSAVESRFVGIEVELLGMDLEIVERELMSQLLLKYSAAQIADQSAVEVHALLQFSLGCGLLSASVQKLGGNSKKIPYLLLEDLLEAQTVLHAEAVWSVIESLTDRLTHPDLFSRGSNILLRMCNSLLRRISKSCHTELCGRVLMFLAAIFPISERSAVNHLGKINVNNVTVFESEDEYKARQATLLLKASAAADNDDDEDQGGVQSMEDSEIDNAVDEMYMDVGEGGGAASPGGGAGDYSSYRTFWDVQSHFLGAAPSHEALAKKVEQVLDLFERHAPAQQDAQLEAAKLLRTKEVASETLFSLSAVAPSSDPDAYLGCKFLTSSELFSLQLRDPLLHQQVCAQVLFMTHSVRQSTRDSKEKGGAAASGSLLDKLKRIENRALALIAKTPRGSDLQQTLLRLLHREGFWHKWKADGCQAFERQPACVSSSSSSSLTPPLKAPSSSTVKGSSRASYNFGKTFDEALVSARALAASVPTFTQHIERFLDAEDPDAGIDEEYHPKHEADYCWRARRLLAAEHLSAFAAMPDGDLAKGLKAVTEIQTLGRVAGATTSATSSVVDLLRHVEEIAEPVVPVVLVVAAAAAAASASELSGQNESKESMADDEGAGGGEDDDEGARHEEEEEGEGGEEEIEPPAGKKRRLAQEAVASAE